MVCGCVRINIKTKPHLGQKVNDNNREHETLNLRVVDPSPTRYVIGPHAVA